MKELEILQEVVFKLIDLKNETDNILVQMFAEFVINLFTTIRFRENAKDLVVAISDAFVELDRSIGLARNDLGKHFVRIASKKIHNKDDIDITTLVLLNNAFPNKPKLLEIINTIYTNTDTDIDEELTEKINELVVLALWKLIQL